MSTKKPRKRKKKVKIKTKLKTDIYIPNETVKKELNKQAVLDSLMRQIDSLKVQNDSIKPIRIEIKENDK